ncbi:MAG: hypothetical protein JW941_02055 [Candidatus Coatesbacteria bacterium]|nr:hypothetical protein [Candidatus Coatesbacteria bacterium]
MKRRYIYLVILLPLLALLVGCTRKDKWFDSDQDANPKVKHANYVDKVNAFKLFIPPGVWRVVPAKRALLALVNRKCVGKVLVESAWLFSDEYGQEAERIAADSFTGDFEWLDKKKFFVGEFPAVIVAARGRILYSASEEFYVERTVVAGVIKYGSRQCQFKYAAPNDCYAETKDDIVNLMLGFQQLDRGSSNNKKKPSETSE